jgi:hypothetical protein
MTHQSILGPSDARWSRANSRRSRRFSRGCKLNEQSSAVASKRRQQPERLIHQALVRHLEWRLLPGTFWWHPATGGKRALITGSLMKSLGSKAGLPDIMIIAFGQVFGIELKADGGRLSAEQRTCHVALREAGATVETADTIDAALDLLTRWRLIR